MSNIEFFSRMHEHLKKQSKLNSEMVGLSNEQIKVFDALNKETYTQMYEYKDKPLPPEMTNTFLLGFSQLIESYNSFLTRHRQKIAEAMKINQEATHTLMDEMEK